MTSITLRILDGADRGRVYSDLPIPVSIGREEGNTIQLSDERVSRFHLRIQEEDGKIVLSDLDSTNGTKVNGERTAIRTLRFGDVVNVGRTFFLYGSRSEIDRRLNTGDSSQSSQTADIRALAGQSSSSEHHLVGTFLQDPNPPALPTNLTPGQVAQVSEMLEFFHVRVRELVAESRGSASGIRELTAQQWQVLLDFQSHLAEYLQKIVEPQ